MKDAPKDDQNLPSIIKTYDKVTVNQLNNQQIGRNMSIRLFDFFKKDSRHKSIS